MKTLTRCVILALACLLPFAQAASAAGPGYRIEYDYLGHSDAWYGHPEAMGLRMDYSPLTDVPSLQGDDFGFGYEAMKVSFRQGPPVERTRAKHTAYEFRFAPIKSCIAENPPLCPETVFDDGFEAPL